MSFLNELREAFSSDDAPATARRPDTASAPKTDAEEKYLVLGTDDSFKYFEGDKKEVQVQTVKPVKLVGNLDLYHMLLAGTSGVGKSVTIDAIIRNWLSRGIKFFVLDSDGELLSKYGRPGFDIVLNPNDARSSYWGPEIEMRDEKDAKMIARGSVPAVEGGEDWQQMAAIVMADMLSAYRYREDGAPISEWLSTRRFYEIAGCEDYESMTDRLKGRTSYRLLTGEAKKMRDSIFTLIAMNVEAWGAFRAIETEEDLRWAKAHHVNLGAWAANDGDRRNIFVNYTYDQIEAMAPFMAMMIHILISKIMGLPNSRTRRIGLMIDEMGELPGMPRLVTALSQGRRKGLRVCGAMQSISQIQNRKRYGREGAQTLLSCFRNVLSFAQGDAETAEHFSKYFGEGDKEQQTRSRSAVTGSNQTTNTTNTTWTPRRVVEYTRLMQLPNLVAVAKFGELNPSFLKMAPYDAPIRNKPFIPAEHLAQFHDWYSEVEVETSAPAPAAAAVDGAEDEEAV